MQRILLSCFTLLLVTAAHSQSPVLTSTNVTGSNSITCAAPVINYAASVSNYTSSNVTFSWTSANSSTTGANVNLTTPGSYTLKAQDVAGTFTLTNVFTIGLNTVSPTAAITPTFQNITCLSGAQSVSCAVNPTTNITTRWYSPNSSGPVVVTSPLSVYTPGGPGTYTVCSKNDVNGCSTCKNFTVASSDNFPLLNVTSPQNFTIGCSSSSVATIILSGGTAPIGGGPVSYTVLPPSVSPNGSYSLSASISNYTFNTPGTYYAIVKDNQNNCQTKVPFSITQDISAPIITLDVPSPTLSCYTPSMALHASSTSTNVIFQWSSGPTSVNGNTLAVYSNTNPNAPIAGVYTITASDLSNSCTSVTSFTVRQNLYRPHASIGGGPFSISCNSPTVVLVNNSTTGIPQASGLPTNSVVAAYLWEGPLPQATASNIATYTAATPGIYTLTAQDLNNGCFSSTTTIVSDSRIYPFITSPTVYTLCSAQSVTITPTVAGSGNFLTYQWTAPAGATITNNSPNGPDVTVYTTGTYTLAVTNIQSNCTSTTAINVVGCTGIAGNSAAKKDIHIFPNPTNGVVTLHNDNPAKNTEVEIYNSLGILITKQTWSSGDMKLNLDSEPAGIYFISIAADHKIIYTSKLIKQ